jgi:hypothetical protein
MTTTVTGVSSAAQVLHRVRTEVTKREQQTATFSNFPLHDQLIDVFEECGNDGWDGDGSIQVAAHTLMLGKALVELLPLRYRTPDITGHPDGHVSLEWYVNTRRLLNVSLGPSGTLHWAALVGSEDPRGSCHFYGDTAPATLLYWLGRVCG